MNDGGSVRVSENCFRRCVQLIERPATSGRRYTKRDLPGIFAGGMPPAFVKHCLLPNAAVVSRATMKFFAADSHGDGTVATRSAEIHSCLLSRWRSVGVFLLLAVLFMATGCAAQRDP